MRGGRRRVHDQETTRRAVKEVYELTATIGAPREALFEVLHDPATTRLVTPEVVVQSFTVPGTGPGSGEIQIAVLRNPRGGALSLNGLLIEQFRPPDFVRFFSIGRHENECHEIAFRSIAPAATAVRWSITVTWPAGTDLGTLRTAAADNRDGMARFLRGASRLLGAHCEIRPRLKDAR